MAPSPSRAQRTRDTERQRQQEEARRLAYERAVRKRRMLAVGVIAAALLAAIGVVYAATGEKNTKTAASSTTATTVAPISTAPTPSVNPNPPAALPTVPPGATAAATGACPAENGSAARTTKFEQAPPMCIDPKRTYNATIRTSKGDLSVLLLPESAPRSVNNFIVLARYHYYDGLPITRIRPRGWAEITDPANADGTPGPGYRIPGEAPQQGSVPTPLIVATLPDGSGTSGGGFLIGLADQAAAMPSNATQIGTIMDARIDRQKPPDGQSTVMREIDRAATASGAPAEVITILGIDIVEVPA